MSASVLPMPPPKFVLDHVSSPMLRKLLLSEEGVKRRIAKDAMVSAPTAPAPAPTRPTIDKRLVDGMPSPRAHKQQQHLHDDTFARHPRKPQPQQHTPVPLPLLESPPAGSGSSGDSSGQNRNENHQIRFPALVADEKRRAPNRQPIKERLSYAEYLKLEAQGERRRQQEQRLEQQERQQERRDAKRQQQAEQRRRKEAQEQERAATLLQARHRGVKARTKLREQQQSSNPIDLAFRRAKALLNHNFSDLESYFVYAEDKLTRKEKAAAAGSSAFFLTSVGELGDDDATISGAPRLGQQPGQRSAKALARHGAQYETHAVDGFVQQAVEAFKEAMHGRLDRIIDVFRSIDSNADGCVSRREFVSVIPIVFGEAWAAHVGLPLDEATMLALFNSFDTDGSGKIEYRELYEALRRVDGPEIAKLRPGAAGAIELHSRNRIALRSSARRDPASRVGNANGALKKECNVAELTAALARGSARAVALLRLLDRNGDGKLSRSEFRAVLPLLGYDSRKCGKVADAVFDSLDLDSSGFLDAEELEIALGPRLRSNLPLPHRTYAYPWEEKRRNWNVRTIQIRWRYCRKWRLLEIMRQRERERLRREQAAVQIQRWWRRRRARRMWLDTLVVWAKKEVADRRKKPAKVQESAGVQKVAGQKVAAQKVAIQKVKGQEVAVAAAAAVEEEEEEEGVPQEERVRRQAEKKERGILWQAPPTPEEKEKKVLKAADTKTMMMVSDIKKALRENSSNILALFRAMDRDHSGCITREELMVTLPLIGLNGDNKEAFDAVFDEIDVDKNGKIEYEELLMALKRRDAVVALQSTYRGAKARRLMPHLRSGPSGNASAKKAVAAAKKAVAAVGKVPPKSARPRSIVGHVQPDAQPDAALAAAAAATAAAESEKKNV